MGGAFSKKALPGSPSYKRVACHAQWFFSPKTWVNLKKDEGSPAENHAGSPIFAESVTPAPEPALVAKSGEVAISTFTTTPLRAFLRTKLMTGKSAAEPLLRVTSWGRRLTAESSGPMPKANLIKSETPSGPGLIMIKGLSF